MTDQDTHEKRLTQVERDLLYVQRVLDSHIQEERELHREIMAAISKLDERTDVISQRTTTAFAVVGVLWALVVILAPFLRQFIGLTAA